MAQSGDAPGGVQRGLDGHVAGVATPLHRLTAALGGARGGLDTARGGSEAFRAGSGRTSKGPARARRVAFPCGGIGNSGSCGAIVARTYSYFVVNFLFLVFNPVLRPSALTTGGVPLPCLGSPGRVGERIAVLGKHPSEARVGIAFTPSERATIGVEWELQLVDRER